MNVSKLSLVLLAISSNLPILGGCCGNKNNGKNKSSKSTPGGGSKPSSKPNPNPNPSHDPSHGQITSEPHGPVLNPSSFTPHGPSFSATTPVDYNNKTLDDIKLPPKFTQEEIGNYEYRILADFGISKEKALENTKNIRYFKTRGSEKYDVFIFFYNIFDKSSKAPSLFEITEHIYYIYYSVDENGSYWLSTEKETPEYFFNN